MVVRDMYIMQLIREHKLNEDNLEEVYESVCKHLEEVETTKLTLERMIQQKKGVNRGVTDELLRITDEMIECIREIGIDVDNVGFDDLLKCVEEIHGK